MELIPAGVHLARCIGLIDLGTQKLTFDGKDKQVHQVRIEFELPTETYEYEEEVDGKKEKKTGTRVIGTNFTVSLSGKATLRKFLESWRGLKFTKEELEGFDLAKVLGKTCQLQIIHSEDGKYANISTALPLMKGIEVPEGKRDLVTFSIEEDEKGNVTGFDEEVFDKLPEWLQTKIQDSKEMKDLFGVTDLDQEEADLKKEAEEKKAEKAEKTEEIETKEVEDLFDGEPKTTTEARAKAKAKVEEKDDDFE